MSVLFRPQCSSARPRNSSAIFCHDWRPSTTDDIEKEDMGSDEGSGGVPNELGTVRKARVKSERRHYGGTGEAGGVG